MSLAQGRQAAGGTPESGCLGDRPRMRRQIVGNPQCEAFRDVSAFGRCAMASARTRSVDVSDVVPLAAVRRDALAFVTDAACLFRCRLRPQLTEAVQLVVSELVSNARRHTAGPCCLRLSADASEVGIEVTDTNPRFPVARAPDPTGVRGGWGWTVVSSVAEEVRVLPGPGPGKRVYARLRR
ncbi:ATP-binding protein [Streptomyces sp. NPDC019396]|uniref:ATP-binding protein n=1 Tax=Streptomyces sp. NPDC019396 TaxID=3154687 RepID=UPI0033D981AA